MQDAENETQLHKDLLKYTAVDKLEEFGQPNKKALDAHSKF